MPLKLSPVDQFCRAASNIINGVWKFPKLSRNDLLISLRHSTSFILRLNEDEQQKFITYIKDTPKLKDDIQAKPSLYLAVFEVGIFSILEQRNAAKEKPEKNYDPYEEARALAISFCVEIREYSKASAEEKQALTEKALQTRRWIDCTCP